MRFNKVQITNNGLRVIEQINIQRRPSPSVKVFYVTDEELSDLYVGEKYVQA